MFWECLLHNEWALWVGLVPFVVDAGLCLATVGCERFLLAGRAAVLARALRAWQTQAVQQLAWIGCIC